jgi:hypothetical protein
MARSTVYRAVGSVRRTPIPRSSSTATGLTSSFGRMLAKLAMAGNSLDRAKPRRRR